MAKEEEDKKAKAKVPTAIKRDIQSQKRRLRNKMFVSKVKTAIRHFEETLKAGAAESSKESLNSVFSLMDKGVKKGVYKQNKANRTKSRLASRLKPKALSV